MASTNVTPHPASGSRSERWQALGMNGAVVWFTGLSGSGKSTVAVEVEAQLVADGQLAVLLDGDNLRHGLNSDLGFSEDDRNENIRRIGEVALLFADAGAVALVPVISPFRKSRNTVRHLVERNGLRFVEVFVDTPIELCEERDPKGLYARARAGEISDFTGLDSPYEPPLSPELTLRPTDGEPAAMARIVVAALSS